MKRMIQLASLACTLAGSAVLARPTPAAATMAPSPLQSGGILSCCSATDKSTSWGTGIEQQTLGFVGFTLRPWLTRIEQRLTARIRQKVVSAH